MQQQGNHQLALELVSIVLGAEPSHRKANEIQAAACRALAAEATSINAIGFYNSGMRMAEARLASPVGAKDKPLS